MDDDEQATRKRFALLGITYNKKEVDKWKAHCRARASRFRATSKTIDPEPADLGAFLKVGGMQRIEYAIGAKAAEEAIKFERKHWLPKLEYWLQVYPDDAFAVACLTGEIKRLKRCLGIRQEPLTLEERRARVRERVQKHRAKRSVAFLS
jgi:hypothetical protein